MAEEPQQEEQFKVDHQQQFHSFNQQGLRPDLVSAPQPDNSQVPLWPFQTFPKNIFQGFGSAETTPNTTGLITLLQTLGFV